MPLSFGLRDEDNERINTAMKKIAELVFVPDWDETALNEQLKPLGTDLNAINSISTDELVDFIARSKFDWANMEQFADVLVKISAKAGYESFRAKALAVYHYIQAESKMFSFEIMGKINTIK